MHCQICEGPLVNGKCQKCEQALIVVRNAGDKTTIGSSPSANSGVVYTEKKDVPRRNYR